MQVLGPLRQVRHLRHAALRRPGCVERRRRQSVRRRRRAGGEGGGGGGGGGSRELPPASLPLFNDNSTNS